MPIVVQHQPSAGLVGDAAYQAALAQQLDRERMRRLQEQLNRDQMAQQWNMQGRSIDASVAEQERSIAAQMAQQERQLAYADAAEQRRIAAQREAELRGYDQQARIINSGYQNQEARDMFQQRALSDRDAAMFGNQMDAAQFQQRALYDRDAALQGYRGQEIGLSAAYQRQGLYDQIEAGAWGDDLKYSAAQMRKKDQLDRARIAIAEAEARGDFTALEATIARRQLDAQEVGLRQAIPGKEERQSMQEWYEGQKFSPSSDGSVWVVDMSGGLHQVHDPLKVKQVDATLKQIELQTKQQEARERAAQAGMNDKKTAQYLKYVKDRETTIQKEAKNIMDATNGEFAGPGDKGYVSYEQAREQAESKYPDMTAQLFPEAAKDAALPFEQGAEAVQNALMSMFTGGSESTPTPTGAPTPDAPPQRQAPQFGVTPSEIARRKSAYQKQIEIQRANELAKMQTHTPTGWDGSMRSSPITPEMREKVAALFPDNSVEMDKSNWFASEMAAKLFPQPKPEGALPLPDNPAFWRVGQIYQLKNGHYLKWTGKFWDDNIWR